MNDQITDLELTNLYNKAIEFTNSHYENFPVLSFFIPKDLRKYIAVVYQFARSADDIADEGLNSNEEKLTLLSNYENELNNSFKQIFKNEFWMVFYDTVTSKKLTHENFNNLIKAFKQDLVKTRYNNFTELFEYCKNSADPVGRIVLEIYDIRDKNALRFSDLICSALQLANFYQDVKIDFEKGRIYIPKNEMEKFGINKDNFLHSANTKNFQELMKFQIERTKGMFKEGRNLLKFLPFRLRLQILVTIKGGETILTKIEKIEYDVLNNRPKLNKFDMIKIFTSSIILGK